MNKEPIVSIIVPIFNTGNFLSRCLNSIITQTYSNIEVILVNDGSTDNSEIVCKEYVEKDSRIKYFYKENSGVSATRNLGLDNATGEYFTFCDSDDEYYPYTIQTLLDVYNADKTTEFAIAPFLKISTNGNWQSKLPNKITKYQIINHQITDMQFTICSSLFRNCPIRFNESVGICEDKLFIVEYVAKFVSNTHSRIGIATRPTYKYYNNPNSATGNTANPKYLTSLSAYVNMNNLVKKYGNISNLHWVRYYSVKRYLTCKYLCNQLYTNAPDTLKKNLTILKTQLNSVVPLFSQAIYFFHLCVLHPIARKLRTIYRELN